jgi:hypothetical protein
VLRAAAVVQQGATVGSWVTCGVLAWTLVASILGALAGVPSLFPAVQSSGAPYLHNPHNKCTLPDQ